MRTPLSWLLDFTPVEAPPAEIARVLSFLGLVVESTEVLGPPLEGIVVARVLGTRSHPNADRIQLVEVDPGDGEPLQICCGAFNMKPGDLVPLATVGTVMPGGTEIARRKMRGEWSNGMLCSAPELGLGPQGPEPAILVLGPGTGTPGQPVADAFGFGADVVFELEISPNRSDCFSMMGVARDLAAATGSPFSVPLPPHREEEDVPAARVEVEADAAHGCPRFTGTVIDGAEHAVVSPLVRRRLALAGMRAVHPVVDASNYVMLELGQPNHPYDITRLGGGGLVVRWAKAGETLVTLDGTARTLSTEDLLIADSDGSPVGVAGIMGGSAAEISASTSTVLLEAANFGPSAIAATGRRLGLLSEARTRFERGVDVELPPRAVDRFVQLLGPAVRRGPMSDVEAARPVPRRAPFRASRANLLLGTELTPGRCAELLTPLGFKLRPCAGSELDFEVEMPSWRPDCSREVDLVEEVARMHGYERIPRSLPARPAVSQRLSRYQARRRLVREGLAGAGLDEAWTSTFLSEGDFSSARLSPDRAVQLENPLDSAQALLRTSLLPGLLSAARSNVERQAATLKLFEIGTVFAIPSRGEGGSSARHPVEGVEEWEQLAWLALGPGVDGSYAVEVWSVLAQVLRLEAELVAVTGSGTLSAAGPASAPAEVVFCLHAGRRAEVRLSGEAVGVLGELDYELSSGYGLPGRAAFGTVDLSLVLGAPHAPLTARPVSRFPASDLDMAFVVADEVTAGAVERTVRNAGGSLVEAVALFDVWHDPSLGKGKRSLAFRARLRAPDHTLAEPEVAEVRARVVAAVEERHSGVFRGN